MQVFRAGPDFPRTDGMDETFFLIIDASDTLDKLKAQVFASPLINGQIDVLVHRKMMAENKADPWKDIGTEDIAEIKASIQAAVTFEFAGQQLEDGHPLSDYDIGKKLCHPNGLEIHIVFHESCSTR